MLGYISGCLVAIILSVMFFFRVLERFRGKIHFILCLGALFGLIWHILRHGSVSNKIPRSVCRGSWLGSNAFRLLRMFILSCCVAEVRHRRQKDDMTLVTLAINNLILFYPGCYYYVFTQVHCVLWIFFTGIR